MAQENKKLSLHGESIAIGGQAVMEGIMLRGPKHWVLSVRRPDGTIALEDRPLTSILRKSRFFRMAFVRGFFTMFDAMVLGMKSLLLSAQIAAGEQEKMSVKDIVIAMVFALSFFLLVFKMLPALAAVKLYESISSDFLINAIEGIMKIALFVGYILIISRLKDVQRVFQYHGAEHQVIHAYESEDKLSVESADGHTRIHVRCGTSFMLLVFFVSVIVFMFMGRPPALERTLLHIAIIPIVAGISYEIIKLSSRFPDSMVLGWITAPGLALQRLTTRKADTDQLEVAVAALGHLVKVEGLEKVEAEDGQVVSVAAAEAPA